jgi:hypothetical protein
MVVVLLGVVRIANPTGVVSWVALSDINLNPPAATTPLGLGIHAAHDPG